MKRQPPKRTAGAAAGRLASARGRFDEELPSPEGDVISPASSSSLQITPLPVTPPRPGTGGGGLRRAATLGLPPPALSPVSPVALRRRSATLQGGSSSSSSAAPTSSVHVAVELTRVPLRDGPDVMREQGAAAAAAGAAAAGAGAAGAARGPPMTGSAAQTSAVQLYKTTPSFRKYGKQQQMYEWQYDYMHVKSDGIFAQVFLTKDPLLHSINVEIRIFSYDTTLPIIMDDMGDTIRTQHPGFVVKGAVMILPKEIDQGLRQHVENVDTLKSVVDFYDNGQGSQFKLNRLRDLLIKTKAVLYVVRMMKSVLLSSEYKFERLYPLGIQYRDNHFIIAFMVLRNIYGYLIERVPSYLFHRTLLRHFAQFDDATYQKKQLTI